MKHKTEREDKYWICDRCAATRGWTAPAEGVTLISGLCGHCTRPDEVLLTPTRDFIKDDDE